MRPFQKYAFLRGVGSGGVGGGDVIRPGLSDRWRLNITAKQTDVAWASAAEIEMRQDAGGFDMCFDGTAAASSYQASGGGSYIPRLPSYAFDNDNAKPWTASSSSLPQQIEYQFPQTCTVEEISIYPNSLLSTSPDDSPTIFDVQYYNGSSWVTYWSVETPASWALNAPRNFNRTDSLNKRKWRLNITAKQSGASWTSVAEIEMRTSAGGADQCSGGAGFASHTGGSDGPSKAFDNSTSTRWTSGTTSVAVQVGYFFMTAPEVIEIALTATSSPNDTPTAFDVQYWNGSSWVTSWSVSTPATWVSGETRVFTKP